MVTGGASIPSVQLPSQGAGQTRPVNSGKLLVLASRIQRLPPLPAVDEVVPLGDEVVDRAARRHPGDELPGVAEGDPAVHAARALRAQGLLGVGRVRLAPVLDPLQRRALVLRLPLVLHESGRLAHG